MKYTLAIAVVLAVVATVCDSSAIKAEPRANLNQGYISPGDRLLYSGYVQRYAAANSQSQDLIYRGSASTRVSAVRATEVGGTQYASAYIVAGGPGYNGVTIRFVSARGWGYYYYVEIFGR